MRFLKIVFAMMVALVLTLMMALVGMVVLDQSYSADQWYVLPKVYVDDAIYGAPIQMAVDRKIIQDFDGRYVVTVRRLPEFKAICSGGSTVHYVATSSLPDPLTLKWWSYGAVPDCMPEMSPGQYEITTCIYINPHILWLPEREVCRKSNIFKVIDVEEIP